MSREIDLQKKLSDEDREFLEQRGDYRALDQNARFIADRAASSKPVVKDEPPAKTPVAPKP